MGESECSGKIKKEKIMRRRRGRRVVRRVKRRIRRGKRIRGYGVSRGGIRL